MIMKALFYTALTLAAPLAMADISLGTSAADAAIAESQAAEAKPYVELAQEVNNAVAELTAILQSVQDQASADASAPQIRSLTARMIELQNKAEAMPRPSTAVEFQVRNSLDLAKVEQTVKDFINSFIRIGMNNAYGSQPLIDALAPIVNAMPGSAE